MSKNEWDQKSVTNYILIIINGNIEYDYLSCFEAPYSQRNRLLEQNAPRPTREGM